MPNAFPGQALPSGYLLTPLTQPSGRWGSWPFGQLDNCGNWSVAKLVMIKH
jgi:hypothetical protein